MTQTLIETLALGGSSSVTSSALGTTYRHLMLVGSVRSTRAVASAGVNVRFNGDTGANYQIQRVRANNTASLASANLALSGIFFDCPGSSAPSGAACAVTLDIPVYDETNFNKQVLLNSFYKQGAAAADQYFWQTGGIWNNTAAISTITLVESNGDNFAAGSVIDIYGIS